MAIRQSKTYAAILPTLGPDNPWYEIEDEFTGDPLSFQERHYSEFVTFLPPVQRLLYGSGRGKPGSVCAESPIKAFRRADVTKVRVALTPDAKPLDLDVAHVDLYFFYEIDVAILALELHADDVPLAAAQDALFRLGRAHPAYWEPSGAAGHCPSKVEFIAKDGRTLSTSDYENREKFLTQVCEKRAARVAAHWQLPSAPVGAASLRASGRPSLQAARILRMPQMAFLATQSGQRANARRLRPFGVRVWTRRLRRASFLAAPSRRFRRARYCYDRYFCRHSGVEWPESRYMSCGHSLVVTGSADNAFFVDLQHGCLNSFRHEHFLVFLIAHFHKAAAFDVLRPTDGGDEPSSTPTTSRRCYLFERHLAGLWKPSCVLHTATGSTR